MSARDKVLAIRRIQKEREELVVSIEVREGKRWDGFLGGIRGILTCMIATIILALLLEGIGSLASSEVFEKLNWFLGFSGGLILSQCIRNKKNERLCKDIQNLKERYDKLTRKTKEIIYA